MSAPASIEQRLGHTFADRQLLRRALTHSTYENEHPAEGPDNERLEFLGDGVLNLLAARLVYERFTEVSEGVLSRRRAALVRREALAQLGLELAVRDDLRLGEGQRKADPQDTDRLLADAVEALAGAVFLDGGFDAAARCFTPLLSAALERGDGGVDWKTELQELCHARGHGNPRYSVLSISGPDHARVYACEVVIDAEVMGTGEGRSKKTAEQLCARAALTRLGVLP